MDFIDQLIFYVNFILNILSNTYIILSLFLIVILYHYFLYLIRDKKHLKNVRKFIGEEKINTNDLKNYPLVTFIVPAWKEGKRDEGKAFHECLISISKLNYPKIKAIVNAGGDDTTINIAESFKKFENFKILRQTGGKSRAAFGKIRALNECLDHISEGILYFIDADCYLTDDLLLRLIYPIINLNEDVVVGGFDLYHLWKIMI